MAKMKGLITSNPDRVIRPDQLIGIQHIAHGGSSFHWSGIPLTLPRIPSDRAITLRKDFAAIVKVVMAS